VEERGALPPEAPHRTRGRSRGVGDDVGTGTPHGNRPPAQTRLRFGGEHPFGRWPQDAALEAPPISHAPPQNPRKPWPVEAPMERWFPSPDGERRSSMTAERRGRPGTQFQIP
jgi:hypothetical protein